MVNEGGIVTEDGKIFKDTETWGQDQQDLLKSHRDISQENPIFFKGILAVISTPGQENWYHWLLQALPRLKILKASGVKYDKIYINNLQYPWQKESLQIVMTLLDIPRDALFLIEGDCVVQADQLLIPSIAYQPSKSPFFPLWLREFLHQCFLKKEDTQKKLPQRIFISRSKAKVRKILEEEKVIQDLEKEGFVKVCLEDLPIYEQAQLFSSAKIIIGPHGSGFANLVFCQPKTTIIELDHEVYGEEQRSIYQRFSHIMGCKYFGYYPDKVEEKDLENDLAIDSQQLITFCKERKIF